MLANDKETARIAWHDKARPSGNQFDGAFLDGYDMGRRAMCEQIERFVADLKDWYNASDRVTVWVVIYRLHTILNTSDSGGTAREVGR